MSKKTISRQNRKIIDEVLSNKTDTPEDIIKKATSLLAKLTNFTVITTTLYKKKDFIKSIQFVQTGKYSAMLVILSSSGTVRNKLFKCNFLLDPKLTATFNSILNKEFSGKLLSEITTDYVQKIFCSVEDLSFVMADIFTAILETVNEIEKNDIHTDGQMNLLLHPEFTSESAMRIIKFLKQPNFAEKLLFDDSFIGTNVFIGEETHIDVLSQSSVISTNYSVNGIQVGTVGIIGPTRMDYGTLIANLEYMANSVSGILEDILDLE